MILTCNENMLLQHYKRDSWLTLLCCFMCPFLDVYIQLTNNIMDWNLHISYNETVK